MSVSENWVVYIILCSDGTLYTGITNNLEKRLLAHSLGTGAKYTRGRGPFEVLYQENVSNKNNALSRESQIKKFTKIKKYSLIRKKK